MYYATVSIIVKYLSAVHESYVYQLISTLKVFVLDLYGKKWKKWKMKKDWRSSHYANELLNHEKLLIIIRLVLGTSCPWNYALHFSFILNKRCFHIFPVNTLLLYTRLYHITVCQMIKIVCYYLERIWKKSLMYI